MRISIKVKQRYFEQWTSLLAQALHMVENYPFSGCLSLKPNQWKDKFIEFSSQDSTFGWDNRWQKWRRVDVNFQAPPTPPPPNLVNLPQCYQSRLIKPREIRNNIMTSQDGHPFNPRPLKRRRITHDQLSATLSKERQSIRPLKAENNESNNDEDSEASIDIRRTTPPSRFGNPSPTIGQYDNNFVQNSQANHCKWIHTAECLFRLWLVNNHQAEEDDIVQTSDIEELLIAEDHDLMSSPHTRRFLLRTSSSSEGHPAFVRRDRHKVPRIASWHYL